MTTAVAKSDEKPSLAQLIKRMEPEIAKALPKHMDPERMARIASTTVRQTPALARCTPESFLGALLTASQLGLEPGPIGEAYFVPFNTKGSMVCQFIPGYRGLIKLARNSGQLVDIWAEIVYDKDEFSYTLGLHRDLQHKPATGDRGEAIYVYAAAELKDGGRPFVVLTYNEVEAIRDRSRASKNGPWVTDWAAMARKTAIKQLAKWLPLSAEFNSAVVLDGTVRTDVGELVNVNPDYVDGEVVNDQAAISDSDPHEVQMISREQIAQLDAALKAEKLTDLDSQLAWLTQAINKPVGALDELTADDATQALDILTAH